MIKKAVLFSAVFILFSFQLFAQNTSNITIINEIADKDQVTYSDGVYFFLLIMGKTPGSFDNNIETLNQEGITTGIALNEDSPLRRGALALMMARHLNLNDSLLFMIFKTERYAYRSCIANGIMNQNGSEWDKISGGELIEIMTRVSDLTGGNE
jgi:hypothetical protein